MNSLKTSCLILVAILCSFLFNQSAIAQGASMNLDSLIQDAENEPSDSIKAEKHLRNSKYFRNHDFQKSLTSASSVIDLAKGLKDTLLLVRGMNAAAVSLEYMDALDSAVILLDKSFELSKIIQNPRSMGSCRLSQGLIFAKIAKYEKSMQSYYKALDYFDQANEPRGVAMTHNNLGVLMKKMKRFDDAIHHYEQVIELSKIQPGPATGMAYENIAGVYYIQKNFKKSKEQMAIAIKEYEQIEFLPRLAGAKSNYAELCVEFKDYDEALVQFTDALDISKKIGKEDGRGLIYVGLVDLYLAMNRKDKAKEMAVQALFYANDLEDVNERLTVKANLVHFWASIGDFRQAYQYQKENNLLMDSISEDNNTRNMAEMEEKFKSKEKAMEIMKLEVSNAQQEVSLNKERATNRIYMILVLAFVILSAIILYAFVQKRKDNEKITTQNTQLESFNEEVMAQRDEIERQKDLVENKHHEIQDSIRYAERIQKALLDSKEYWEQIGKSNFIFFKPRDVVSGDFHWAYQTKTGKTIWAAADCTGHGVPGAFMSMLGIGFLNEIVIEGKNDDPGIILDLLRVKIKAALAQTAGEYQQQDGMDIALCVLDEKRSEVRFAGAHNPLVLISKEKKELDAKTIESTDFTLYEVKASKQPVGLYKNVTEKPFETKVIPVASGDVLFTYSDGYVDQFGGKKGNKFMSKRFKNMLLSMQEEGLGLADQKEKLIITLDAWMQEGDFEQLDDICVIGVTV